MNGIQVLLIGGVVAIFLYYMLKVRSALLDLLAIAAFALAAIYFILVPDAATRIAHRLGVGRGADLLFYCCILFFLFIVLKLFARIRRLEQTITDLVREEAKRR